MTPDDLLAAVRQRLDETERIARACRHQNWTHDGASIYGDHPTDEIVDWVYDDAGWEHIALHDPAAVLRRAAADREILAEVESWRHRVCEDSWYSCSQATEDNGYEEYLACADGDRVGLSCDCGLDQRKLRILLPLASGLGIDLETTL